MGMFIRMHVLIWVWLDGHRGPKKLVMYLIKDLSVPHGKEKETNLTSWQGLTALSFELDCFGLRR